MATSSRSPAAQLPVVERQLIQLLAERDKLRTACQLQAEVGKRRAGRAPSRKSLPPRLSVDKLMLVRELAALETAFALGHDGRAELRASVDPSVARAPFRLDFLSQQGPDAHVIQET